LAVGVAATQQTIRQAAEILGGGRIFAKKSLLAHPFGAVYPTNV